LAAELDGTVRAVAGVTDRPTAVGAGPGAEPEVEHDEHLAALQRAVRVARARAMHPAGSARADRPVRELVDHP
jgi:hypothetical protein